MRMMFMPTYWMLILAAPLNYWTVMVTAQPDGQISPTLTTDASYYFVFVAGSFDYDFTGSITQRRQQAIHRCLEQSMRLLQEQPRLE